ncbi:hypothetical protein MHBO_002918 [Bonamia ostreae]|uniref:Uncharacterized protein n=1 Tax=Bonamia ostreae TaxID=126728 RepID=A0ABV2ANY6_9EUKA
MFKMSKGRIMACVVVVATTVSTIGYFFVANSKSNKNNKKAKIDLFLLLEKAKAELNDPGNFESSKKIIYVLSNISKFHFYSIEDKCVFVQNCIKV